MSSESIKGTFGAAPVGAPHEVAQPLTDATLSAQLEQARRNERELAPFNPTPAMAINARNAERGTMDGSIVGAAAAGAEEPFRGDEPETRESSSQNLNAAAKALSEARRARESGEAHQPAASNTDSPSRGIPRDIADPGKVITGGFGPQGEAQYYAINGYELQEIVRSLLDQLADRITNDLRFSMALTYPRLTARLKLEIEGWATDAGFVVEHVKTPEKQTPVEFAGQFGDQVVFVLTETKREFDDQGQPENPPDRMREELGMPIPRKQMVQAGGQRLMVDIVPLMPEDTF